jgi:hypothetical protein
MILNFFVPRDHPQNYRRVLTPAEVAKERRERPTLWWADSVALAVDALWHVQGLT